MVFTCGAASFGRDTASTPVKMKVEYTAGQYIALLTVHGSRER